MSTTSGNPEQATASPTPGPSSLNANLTYYTQTKRSPSPQTPPETKPERDIVKNRLYVGNLHQTVDEYSLLKVFSKFGKISKLDFLFFKTGPNRGKPRGFAFVEYADVEDATKALVRANEKMFRGRKLVVTYANQAPNFDNFGASGSGGKHYHRRAAEMQRPTTLSLIKSASQPGRTEDKIAALEAKLLQMERSSDAPAASTLNPHPSLPLKPPPSTQPRGVDEPETRGSSSTSTSVQTPGSWKPSGPRLPIGERKRVASIRAGRTADTAATSMTGPASIGKKPTLKELMEGSKRVGDYGLLRR